MCEKDMNELLGSALDYTIKRKELCEALGEHKLIGLGRSFRNKTRAMSL